MLTTRAIDKSLPNATWCLITAAQNVPQPDLPWERYFLFILGYKCVVFKHCSIALGVWRSGGLFGHKAEMGVRILGGSEPKSFFSDDEHETNGHFMSLTRIKSRWGTYKFIFCLLCYWRTARTLICCPHIILCNINRALNFPLKHDTAGLSETIKKHNDI